MKKIIKSTTSPIITNGYTYSNNSASILIQLDIEQGNFCAYTEEYYCPGYAREVEHFNPSLKGTTGDGYNNWFSASTRFNKHKGSTPRWNRHQPILHPTSSDLETRLLYKDGYYILASLTDTAAENLKNFLFLNEYGLPEARVSYIDSLKFLFGTDIKKMKAFLLKFPTNIKYRRALETEFGIIL